MDPCTTPVRIFKHSIDGLTYRPDEVMQCHPYIAGWLLVEAYLVQLKANHGGIRCYSSLMLGRCLRMNAQVDCVVSTMLLRIRDVHNLHMDPY